jgi:hypothetical protein
VDTPAQKQAPSRNGRAEAEPNKPNHNRGHIYYVSPFWPQAPGVNKDVPSVHTRDCPVFTVLTVLIWNSALISQLPPSLYPSSSSLVKQTPSCATPTLPLPLLAPCHPQPPSPLPHPNLRPHHGASRPKRSPYPLSNPSLVLRPRPRPLPPRRPSSDDEVLTPRTTLLLCACRPSARQNA